MGNGTIWFTPATDEGSRAITIDLGSGFSDRAGPSPVVLLDSVESGAGYRVTTLRGGRNRYEFAARWDSSGGKNGRQIRRKLYALVNHLARGGTCMVAENSSYAWAAFCAHRPRQNATKIHPGRNLFEPLVTTIDVTGRELLLQSDHSSFVSEMALCDSFSTSHTSVLNLVNGLVMGFHGTDWVLVREFGSYPALRLPEGTDPASILHSDHENSWILELPLEDDPAVLDLLARSEQDAAGGTGINPSPYDTTGAPNTSLPGTTGSPGGWWIP